MLHWALEECTFGSFPLLASPLKIRLCDLTDCAILVRVISAEEFHRLKGNVTGKDLIAALQASPFREVDIEPERKPMPVRDVKL